MAARLRFHRRMDLRTPTTTVFVSDLEAGTAFYALVLGAEPDETPKGHSAYWRLPDGTALLVASEGERAGGARLTVGTDDLLGTIERVLVAGYPAGEIVTGVTGRFAEVRDEDGNAVTLQEVRLTTPGSASVADAGGGAAPSFTAPELRTHARDECQDEGPTRRRRGNGSTRYGG